MMWDRYDYGNGMMDGWFWMIIFWIIIGAVVIGIIVLLVYTVTKVGQSKNQAGHIGQVVQDRSLQLLNERLAKGEITLDEYNSIKEALTRDKK